MAEGTYSAGEVLFDKNDPSSMLQRMDHYFLTPGKPYEINGQVNHVVLQKAWRILKTSGSCIMVQQILK